MVLAPLAAPTAGSGDRRRQRAEHHVDDALAGMGARSDRRREIGVEQRALRRHDIEEIEQAVIVRHVRVEQRLQRIEHARDVAVSVTLMLPGTCGAVPEKSKQHDAVAAMRRHRDAHLDRDVAGSRRRHRPSRLSKRYSPGANARERVAHAASPVRRMMSSKAAASSGTPRSLDHLAEAPHAEPAGRDLREIVAAALLRHARIEQQQIEEVLLQLALRGTGGSRGMRSAFLIDLGHAARHAARRHAADVGVMRDVAHEGDELAVRGTPASPC